ncbi:MAG TPA: regulatory iron-sulfur-containing complex subunit RicT [bacterium]
MHDYIEVVFKGERKQIYVNPQQFPFKIGDYVIVEADNGEDLGEVNQLGALLSMKKSDTPFKSIMRKTNKEDLEKLQQNRDLEKKAFLVCKEKIEKHSLNMKLVDVEYQFDAKKITFYFTAERRVDFRELVKDLAAQYKVRIELRQIGVRDEARRFGGYGICGRKLCCTSFLKEFDPITTQCAKEQNLPLNPQKLSGVCGRLMCCLNYERNFYLEVIEKFPPVESKIKTPKGLAIIDRINVFLQAAVLKYENDEYEVLTLKEINELLHKDQQLVDSERN